MTRPNGWQATAARRGRPIDLPPTQPTEFEQVAAIAGMNLTTSPITLAHDPAVRQFVKSRYQTKFVPEAVLVALGLDMDSRLG